MAKIVHLTTVHSPFDNRIFHRECRSLARAGYEVVLIASHERDEQVGGVQIRALPSFSGRFPRMTRGVLCLLRAALREKAAVYHFHDPELIPAGLVLRLLGKQVVYDVHEDYATAILHREYLPVFLRSWISKGFTCVERFSSRFFELVLAERYYAERFPQGETVLNYSRFPEMDERVLERRPAPAKIHLLYTGNVKDYRGAFLHVRLLEALPEAELFLVGRCSPELAAELETAAGPHAGRLHMEGVGSYVPHERIVECYLQKQWTAGLAIFPPTYHTFRKELTKIFEYMAYGIPLVCSAFPNLRRIVEKERCGICVDPDDPDEAVRAVRWLADHPGEARAMGMRGRRAARRKYNWKTEEEKLLRFYRELCRPAITASYTS